MMLALQSQTNVDFAFLSDKWVKLDPTEIKDMLKQFGADESVLSQLDTTTVSKEDQDMVRTAFKDHPFVQLKDKLGSEEVSGVKTDKYSVAMNYGEMKPFIETIKPVLKKASPELKDADFDDMSLCNIADSNGQTDNRETCMQHPFVCDNGE
jgi:hypothetical protein